MRIDTRKWLAGKLQENMREEIAGYLVEDAGDSSIARKIIAWIKAQIMRLTKFNVKLTAADITEMARTALRNAPIALAAQDSENAFALKGAIAQMSAEDQRAAHLMVQYADVEGAPTPAEIRDAVRQFRDVERAYGGREAWQKAKDAGRTELGYDQWVMVRTPNFKRFFGEWEAAGLHNRVMATSVASVTTSGLLSSGPYKVLRQQAKDLYHGPSVVTNDETHEEIRVESSGLDSALQHGISIQKRAVIGVLDELLKNATFVVRDTQGMRPGVRSVETFACRVTVDGDHFVARLVVREVADGRRFYDHELSTLEPESARPTSNSGGSEGASANRQSEPRPLVSLGKRILSEALSINPATVSKVVNPRTGEPLVVYHGTTNSFEKFDSSRIESDDGAGFFFASNTESANQYAGDSRAVGGNVIPAYLSIKNPYEVTNSQWQNAEGLSPDEARKAGHDGYIVRGMNRGSSKSDTFIAFRPEQIKSATANVGTFNPESRDIRFSRELAGRGMAMFSRGTNASAEQFREELKKAIRSQKTNYPAISLGGTPGVLRATGAADLPLVIWRDTVRKATNKVKHHVSMYAVERLPELLSDPIAVFDSRTEQGSLVVLVDAFDDNGSPIIAAIHLNRREGRAEVNRIASVYGKDGADSLRSLNLRYLNEKKSPELVRHLGLIPRSGSPAQGSGKRVLGPEDIGNGPLFSRAAPPTGASLQSPTNPVQGAMVPPAVPPVPPQQGALNVQGGATGHGATRSIQPLRWLDTVIYRLQDKHIDLKRVQEAIWATGRQISDAINTYDEGGTHATPLDEWAKAGDLPCLDQKESPAFGDRSGLRLPRDVRQTRGVGRTIYREPAQFNQREAWKTKPRFRQTIRAAIAR